jgi:hypothetical protein
MSTPKTFREISEEAGVGSLDAARALAEEKAQELSQHDEVGPCGPDCGCGGVQDPGHTTGLNIQSQVDLEVQLEEVRSRLEVAKKEALEAQEERAQLQAAINELTERVRVSEQNERDAWRMFNSSRKLLAQAQAHLQAQGSG